MLAMRLERRDFASTSSSLSEILALPRPNPFTPLNWTKVMVCVGYCGSLWVIVGHVLLGGPFFLDSYSMSPRSFKETKACSPGPAWSELMTNSSQILHKSPSSFTYVERAKSSL